jgi:cardiolipin synthase A/B
MRLRHVLLLGIVFALGGCAGSNGAPAAEEDLVEYFDEGKADGTGGVLTNARVDGAKSRIFATLTRIPDGSMSSRLIDASRRNVDVELYIVQTKPGSAATVISAQHLEASGVHTVVDREDRCLYAAVIDDQVTTVGPDKKITRSKNAEKVQKAVEAFDNVLKSHASPQPRTVEPGTVRLLRMPDDTGAEILGVIAGATSSIDLEIYQVEDPAITGALVAAAGRQVKVRVMLEPKTVGAVNYTAEAGALQAGGVEVQPTPPYFDTSRKVDHAKFMVIDGSALLFGSGNLVCSGLGGNPAQEFDTRDFWVEDGRVDSVLEASQLFEADWSRQSSQSIVFNNLVVTPDNANEQILALIDSAMTRLLVYNQSLNDNTVIEHLIAAKNNGVDVHVLLGLQPGYGGDPPANQAAIDRLVEAKIPAALFSRHYLHTKAIVADDRAYVGSQNFTSGGLRNNREVGEIFFDATVVQQIEQTFLDDEQAPTP